LLQATGRGLLPEFLPPLVSAQEGAAVGSLLNFGDLDPFIQQRLHAGSKHLYSEWQSGRRAALA